MTFLFTMGSFNHFHFFIVFSSLLVYSVTSTEFLVGGKDGWVVPSSKNDHDMYNKWASRNRFKVNDTLLFNYNKDSVMMVSSEEEYQKCECEHPTFFSNDGKTIFKLDRSGFFYFVSGVSGHCGKGQRMVIKVLEFETPDAAAPASNHQNSTKIHKNSSVQHAMPSIILMLLPTLALFFV